MGCSSFNDKYQECGFLIEELKLITIKTFSGNYTENEIIALNQFKYEKEEKKKKKKRKIKRLKDELYDILDEYDNSDSNCSLRDSSYEDNKNDIQIEIS